MKIATHEYETQMDIKNSFVYAKRFLELDLEKMEDFNSICHDYLHLMVNKKCIPNLARGLLLLTQEAMQEFSKYEDNFLTFSFAVAAYQDCKTGMDYLDYIANLDAAKADEIEPLVTVIRNELEDMGDV